MASPAPPTGAQSKFESFDEGANKDIVVAAMGYNATECLVLSQMVLSIALPLPMSALVIFTHRRGIMGEFATGRPVNFAAWFATLVVLSLNAVLLLGLLGVAFSS